MTTMGRILCSICLMAFVLLPAWAQEEQSISPFLFDEYKDATVFMGATQAKGKMNFYIPTGEFFYMDETDGNRVKVLANVEQVNMIRFGSRIFLPSEKGGVEVLSSEPLLYVKYQASIRNKGKQVGYGGTSSLGSIKSFSVNSSGTSYVSDPMIFEVGHLYNTYYIGKKQKEIKNMKQLLKFYAKHKETLEEYMKEKDIKFNNALQMLQLVQYANSLK